MTVYPNIITGASAEARLAQLGLDPLVLTRVAQRARAEAATCTPLDALGAGGMVLWSRMLRYLREEMAPHGWEMRRSRGSELTINTDYGVKLLVTSGDRWTGSSVGSPQPKNPKGPTFFEAIADNNLAFDFGPEFEDPTNNIDAEVLDALTTWIVVYRLTTTGELFLEVSRPGPTQDGFVVWTERIILSVPSSDEPTFAANGFETDSPYSLTIERLA